MKNVITITTDLGDNFAAAQLQAVITSMGYKGKIIENHDVTHFSITEGAFQIMALCKFCPKNSIHVGIVDPGVGSDRRGIIIRTNNYWFVGPDNGLLYPAAEQDGIQTVCCLQETKISDYVSNTFHGRDVFVKAAVYLSQKITPEAFQSQDISISHLQKLSFQNGQVLHIDHYGNIKIYWPKQIVVGEKLIVKNKKFHLEVPIVKTFSDVPPQSPLALLGSHLTLELAVNLVDAARLFDIHINDVLTITDK